MRATIKDVAREAGVSVSTVSYVLHRTGKPRTDIQRRVLEAVERLKYIPSATARSLVRKKTNSIGVVIRLVSPSGFHDPHLAQEMSTINHALAEHGYWMNLFLPPKYDDALLQTFLRDANIDGLIWTSQPIPKYLQDIMESRNLPYVQIEHNLSTDEVPSSACRVVIDYMGGLKNAIEYLCGLGHKKIAFMGFSRRSVAEMYGDPLHKTAVSEYKDIIASMGLEYSSVLYGNYTVKGAYSALIEFAQSAGKDEFPTAIVALSDPMALGILLAAKKLGIDIPGALSVIGFDDVIHSFSDTPGLTTMAYPFTDTVDLAVRYLDECIKNDEIFTPEPSSFTPNIIVRDTTAAPGIPAESL